MEKYQKKEIFYNHIINVKQQKTINNLSEFINQINKLAAKMQLEIKCFGTLSTFDLCILTLSNEVDKIIDFVYNLQKISFDKNSNILTSYSIVNYISDDYNCVLSNRCNDCIANIQITYKNGMDTDILIDEIAKAIKKANVKNTNKIESYSVLGEYDLCLHIPINKLPLTLFADNGIFNSNSPFFKNYIQQCNTRFAKKEKYKFDNPLTTEISNKQNQIEEKFGAHIDNYMIPDVIKDLNSKSFFQESRTNKLICHLLYIDYLKAFSLRQNDDMAKDLCYQFEAIVRCIISVFSDYKIDDYNEIAAELSTLFSSSVHNMVQAYDLTIGEPYSYFKNTAVFQKVFLSYYGFVKNILSFIYLNCSNKQSELVPIITFEPVNMPMSNLYLYIENKTPQEVDQQRIVALRLPFDSINKLEVYLPLLVHEISHYLCPIDRTSRNQLMLKLCFKHYFSRMLYDIYKDIFPDRYADFNLYQEFVSVWIDNNINEIIKILKDAEIVNFTKLGITFSDELEIILDSCFSKYHKKYKIKLDSNNASDLLYNTFKKIVNEWIIHNGLKTNEDEYLNNDIIILQGRNDTYIKEISQISSGIKEAVCDIMMINFFNLSPACYFSLIVIAMLNQRLENNDSNEGLDSIIRMGLINSYINENKNNYNFAFSDNDKEKIKNIIYLIDNNYQNEKYKKEINHNIEQINNNICKYNRIYSKYTSEFKSITACYNFDDFGYINNLTKYSQDKSMSGYLVNCIDAIKKVIETYENYENNVITSRINTNIYIINKLYNQMSLSELGELYKKCQSSKSIKSNKIELQEKAKQKNNGVLMSLLTDFTLQENNLEYAFRDAKAILMDEDYPNDGLWYRGQEYAKWGVTPALFRYDSQNFRNKLIDLYEWFRAEACESLEIHTNIDSNADWIACMQHYFVPTHFLDWSEQPFPALYFALENFFDDPCKFSPKKPVPECSKAYILKDDAALFVLNPYRMNRILNGLQGIPNISIKYNENSLMEYVLPIKNSSGIMTVEDSIDFFNHPQKHKWEYMPIAVMTSQLNSRIKAQKGHFIAYNLQVDYNTKKNRIEDITNLYNIQETLYKMNKEKGKPFKPFMAKIIIPYKVKEKMADLLNIYGINKSTYYPELMNIGSDITKRIFK